MNAKRVARNRRRGGFTLLEILVVVGIIALLAAFVVPQFINTRSRAEITTTQSQVSNGGPIATAINTFRISVGRYPTELGELSNKPDDEDEANKWTGPYITDPASLKDAWGHEFKYESPGKVNEETFDLWSMGPDGQDGTDDDITNYTKE